MIRVFSFHILACCSFDRLGIIRGTRSGCDVRLTHQTIATITSNILQIFVINHFLNVVKFGLASWLMIFVNSWFPGGDFNTFSNLKWKSWSSDNVQHYCIYRYISVKWERLRHIRGLTFRSIRVGTIWLGSELIVQPPRTNIIVYLYQDTIHPTTCYTRPNLRRRESDVE